MPRNLAIFYIASPRVVEELSVLKAEVQKFHLPALLHGPRVEVLEGKYSSVCSHCCHTRTIFFAVLNPCNNHMRIKWSVSSKSCPLNPYPHLQALNAFAYVLYVEGPESLQMFLIAGPLAFYLLLCRRITDK